MLEHEFPWVLICPMCLGRLIGSWEARETILAQPCVTPDCQWTWEYIPKPAEAV